MAFRRSPSSLPPNSPAHKEEEEGVGARRDGKEGVSAGAEARGRCAHGRGAPGCPRRALLLLPLPAVGRRWAALLTLLAQEEARRRRKAPALALLGVPLEHLLRRQATPEGPRQQPWRPEQECIAAAVVVLAAAHHLQRVQQGRGAASRAAAAKEARAEHGLHLHLAHQAHACVRQTERLARHSNEPVHRRRHRERLGLAACAAGEQLLRVAGHADDAAVWQLKQAVQAEA